MNIDEAKSVPIQPKSAADCREQSRCDNLRRAAPAGVRLNFTGILIMESNLTSERGLHEQTDIAEL